MNNCHLSPTFINCSASVQPGITCVDGKRGWLTALHGTVKDRPVNQRAGVFTVTVSVFLGISPVPDLRILYCSSAVVPSGKVTG